jgi:hypothetical protein
VAERIEMTRARLARPQDRARTATSARVPRLVSQIAASKPFRVPEVVVGVLLVIGCALLAVMWSQNANATTTVVVASRSIARGHVISADDLRGTPMSGPTSAMIVGANAKDLLGQVALVDISPGEPFARSLVAAASPLSAGEALTSMALTPGQLPPDLAAGDHVRVVVTAAVDAAGAMKTLMLDAGATVWSVVTAPDGATTIVTVRGPISLSSDVAAASKVQLARVDGH